MRGRIALLAALLAATGGTLRAQSPSPMPVWGEVFSGSELETYLRILQTVGAVPSYPWSVRAFSPTEIAILAPRDTGHPWVGRYDFRATGTRIQLALLRLGGAIRFNSAFPYGVNDGAVWSGRGFTTALEGGVAARYGPVSVTVAPMAFRAENAAFTLMPTGGTGGTVYRDGFYGATIDLPQRFGDTPYTVLDPGQSAIRLDAGGAALGLSAANQYWGPAREYPILLGNNAAGFPHVFLGTATPLDLYIVRLHGRLVWGRLDQSPYAPSSVVPGFRFGAGLVALFTSRYVPGVEVGVSRFSHTPWRAGGPTLDDILAPLRYDYRANIARTVVDNQLASAFFRWVLPRSGLEVYAEYGREDYNQNLRDFVQEPDHIGGYTVGFAKTFRAGAAIRVVRAELQDLQAPVIAQGRNWVPFYTHGSISQGHTHRGQLLGSYAGVGGAGAIAAFDTYGARGRWTVFWSRVLRRHRGGFAATGVEDPEGLDVMHSVGWNALFFRDRYEITAGVTAVYELNRDFRQDAFNLHAMLGVRASWP